MQDHPAAQRPFHVELVWHPEDAAIGNSQQPADTHDSDIIITMKEFFAVSSIHFAEPGCHHPALAGNAPACAGVTIQFIKSAALLSKRRGCFRRLL
jgi:hypothetical protein